MEMEFGGSLHSNPWVAMPKDSTETTLHITDVAQQVGRPELFTWGTRAGLPSPDLPPSLGARSLIPLPGLCTQPAARLGRCHLLNIFHASPLLFSPTGSTLPALLTHYSSPPLPTHPHVVSGIQTKDLHLRVCPRPSLVGQPVLSTSHTAVFQQQRRLDGSLASTLPS